MLTFFFLLLISSSSYINFYSVLGLPQQKSFIALAILALNFSFVVVCTIKIFVDIIIIICQLTLTNSALLPRLLEHSR